MTVRNKADEDRGSTKNPARTPAKNNAKASQTNPNMDAPGARTFNPLGNFASYTYQITLYMITPDAYDAFVLSGRKNINVLNNASNTGAGAYIIAQSGGINNTTTNRAPGFELDYYLDNLKIIGAISGKTTQSAANVFNISFQVIEPYGFSFIQNLRRASDAISSYSQALGNKQLQNPTKQFFILGIRFLGYDIHGNPLTGNEDPFYSGTSDALYERFYDILITEIKFKIDGKTTTYNISAVNTPSQTAYGSKRGFISNPVPIEAATVEEALTGEFGLLTALNNQEEEQVGKSISEKNVWSVEFIRDASEIAKSSLITRADLDKSKWGTENTTTKESNDASSVKATPKPTKKKITFSNGAPIIQVIDEVISQSTYLLNAMKTVYPSIAEQVDPNKKDLKQVDGSNKKMAWYHISPEITNARWDDKRGDFAYNIKFIIEKYETPVLQNLYSNPGSSYYGPFKRYDYWYTGKNSEVIAYEQNMDNLYYNVGLGVSADQVKSAEDIRTEYAQGGGADIPIAANQRQPMSKTGRLNIGKEAQNAVKTDLYSPDSYATAKITILGDPDFLMSDTSSSVESAYSKFYTNGFTINPNGGQVFIEIDFKEAEDYDVSTGLLTINQSIQFWKYPEEISKLVKGVSYMVVKAESRFSGGSFTQVLECVINTFSDAETSASGARELEQTTGGPSASGTSTTGTGLKQDPAKKSNVQTNQSPPPNNKTTTQGTGTADDDNG